MTWRQAATLTFRREHGNTRSFSPVADLANPVSCPNLDPFWERQKPRNVGYRHPPSRKPPFRFPSRVRHRRSRRLCHVRHPAYSSRSRQHSRATGAIIEAASSRNPVMPARGADIVPISARCRHLRPDHQPLGLPLFCWSSHVFSGAKYSTSALPDIWRLPVITCSASGHGFDWPMLSIAFSFCPTALLP